MTGSATRRVAYNTAVQTAGKAVVLLIGAASIALLTRYLGPGDYGKFTLALVYLQVFGVAADVGLYTIAVREISRRPERTRELVGNLLALRLLLSIAVVCLAGGVSLLLPYAPDTRVAILIAGVQLVVGLMNSSLFAIFQARLLMDRVAVAETAGRAVTFAAAVLVVVLDLGFYAVVATTVVGTLATLAITVAFARRLVPIRFEIDLRIWKRLLAASLPLGAALALNDLYLRADTFIISLSRSFEDVGLYSLAFRVFELVSTMPQILLITIFPLLTQYLAVGDERRSRGAIQNTFDVLVTLGVPLAAAGLVLAPDVVELVAGADFDEAAVPLQILLFAAALSFVNGLFGFTLIASDRQADVLRLNVVSLTVNVSLNVALVPRYGIEFAAITAIVSESVILGGYYRLMRRRVNFFPGFAIAARVVVASVVMATVLFLLRDGPLWLLAPLAVVLYGAVLYAIGGVDRSVLARLRGATL